MFKKWFGKEKSDSKSSHSEESKLPEIIQQKLTELEKVLNHERKAELLLEAGSLYLELGKSDQALIYLEEAFESEECPREVQVKLMNLYNTKRREALVSGNNQLAETYSNKIEGLLKFAKDSIRNSHY
ncbi:hypothetical protein [Metabacillus arenae]|uniref:Tetratricopeptide repeat protein n=1 Tax=Metabacillus arenae TaxID=2771434 RepID=A0A926RYE2_9BACI|nr:hypothetical protein [Metabacillus arenae]MBD1381976.1 hypothetical protein [Metabacillus arenae]